MHHLRDLAKKIDDLCRDHPAYSQAHQIVTNCTDHLCAVAATHEANLRNLGLKDKIEELEKKRAT